MPAACPGRSLAPFRHGHLLSQSKNLETYLTLVPWAFQKGREKEGENKMGKEKVYKWADIQRYQMSPLKTPCKSSG